MERARAWLFNSTSCWIMERERERGSSENLSKPLTSVELARPLLGRDKDNDKKMTRMIAR